MNGSKAALHPTVSRNDKFLTWQSVTLLIIFFWCLRSSVAPFIHPGEARTAASSSYYYSVMLFLYIWALAAATLTIIPHFSSQHNEIIAAALFFPMTFVTIGTQLMVRFFTRLAFYFSVRSGILNIKQGGDEDVHASPFPSEKSHRDVRKLKMTPFHRPFRKLVKSSVIISFLLSLLYHHCWSSSLSAFKVHVNDGASPICKVTFFPFISEYENGADEYSIWILWGVLVLLLLISHIQDEFLGFHGEAKHQYFSLSLWNLSSWNMPRKGEDIGKVDDDNDTVMAVKYLYDNEPNRVSNRTVNSDSRGISDVATSLRSVARHTFRSKPVEGPIDTLPMVPWLNLLLVSTCIDIVLQLKVFLGRFDARSMQSTLRNRPFCANDTKSGDKSKEDLRAGLDDLKEFYPGCIFDYSTPIKRPNSDGFWFDFMADCGDGFNSSYQVARMLAQQYIRIEGCESKMSLPRGEFLVIGGDLAYPNPTKESFEKRFFRTFEDAMSPPPSFRRANIATKKPDIQPKGWNNCSLDNKIFEAYKGPSTFIIPGNHDWYDGLATFTRFILCRNWLGGWLMPQERSYFALKLPQGWWLFGMDCALNRDIDTDQYKFFADLAQHKVAPSDSVIIVTHEPHWVTDFESKTEVDDLSEANIRELMNTHLQGKVRMRLAGDLHHYTRHVPVTRSHQRHRERKRSMSAVEGKSRKPTSSHLFEPFIEENKPELIVSGGGGAFLHGTHTFSKDIKVGENQNEYVRVCAYPTAKVSHRIAWLNIWHFRWRNWRFDIVWAVLYLGLVYSLFPLCGIYADYESFNPSHNPILLPIWSFQKVFTLMWRIVIHERVSLFFCFITIIGCLLLQAGEKSMKPVSRFLWGLCLAFAHITTALTCILFVESVAEWVLEYGSMNISSNDESLSTGTIDGINLASSLYNEYTTHFSSHFSSFTENEVPDNTWSGLLSRCLKSIKSIPLLTTTMKLFDLPGSISQNHQNMCSILCSDGTECLLIHDPAKYSSIERTTFVPYLTAIALYFIFVAVPLGGGTFGNWIALSMNLFSVQNDLGFSSLQLQHWKNYLKLHVMENGDVEIFAIGLNRVPTRWMKDPQWRIMNEKNSSIPSWDWHRPSKWIPQHEYKKYAPVIVDRFRIKKRRISPLTPTNGT